jgi:hypothetical protein
VVMVEVVEVVDQRLLMVEVEEVMEEVEHR